MIVNNRIEAGRTVDTVVGHIVVVDTVMAVGPRAAVAVEAVLVHRAAGVDPDYNS